MAQGWLTQELRDNGDLVASSGCGMVVSSSGTMALHDNVRSGEGTPPRGIFPWEHAPGPSASHVTLDRAMSCAMADANQVETDQPFVWGGAPEA